MLFLKIFSDKDKELELLDDRYTSPIPDKFHWVKEKGYDCGSSSYPYPTAIMKGDYDSYDLPWKWKNFKPAQKKTVHGVMVGDARNGPVTVYIFQ